MTWARSNFFIPTISSIYLPYSVASLDVGYGSQAADFRQFYSTAAVEHKADAQYMLSRKTESERLLLL
jgi:hypothetical protein